MPQFKKILKSQRGGKILIDHEGYLYNYLRETAKGSTWACRAKYKLNCNARIYYNEDKTELDMTVEHCHQPKIGEARTIEILRNMKSSNSTKYCYKVKKELMKGVSDSDLDQNPPTLLNTKLPQLENSIDKRDKITEDSEMLVDVLSSQTRYNWSRDTDKPRDTLSGDTDVTSRDTDMLVDVDTNSFNVDITQEAADTDLDTQEVLQHVIGQLLNDPQLLQGIVSSLTENERETLVNLGAGERYTETVGNPGGGERSAKVLDDTTHLNTTPEHHQHQHHQHHQQQPAMELFSNQTPPQNQLKVGLEREPTNMGTVETENPALRPGTENHALRPGTPEQPPPAAVPVPVPSLPPSTLQSILPATSMPVVTTTALPNTIISNQIVYKRMGQVTGSTIYFTPPALNNPYCRQCSRSFTSPEQLDDHYNKLQSCDLCKIAFCVPTHYEKHMELNHPDGIKSAWGTLCETCGRVFGVAFQLDSHRAKCSNRLSLRCPRCFYSFGFEEDLKRHKEQHEDMEMLKCADCNRAFPTEMGLQAHTARKIQNKGPFTCLVCGKIFCLKCDFGKHVKAHINEGNADPMVCKFCTQIFSNPQQLLQHEATHLDVNICKFCGIKCVDSNVLGLHEKAHLNNVVLQQSVENVSVSPGTDQQQDNSEYFKGVVNEMESLINSL